MSSSEVAKKSTLQEDFNNRLREFIEDESYYGSYDRYTPMKSEVLVKLFKYSPSDSMAKDERKGFGDQKILMPSKLSPGKMVDSTVAKSERYYPIVKVFRKGLEVSDDIKIGQTYIVPYNDVVGEKYNPEFIHAMQFATQSKGKAGYLKIPDGLEEIKLNLDINWDRYKFSMPDRIGGENDDDKQIFLLPLLKLVAIYNPEL